MKISPISSQTNFKGEFKRTEALDKAMEKASDYDLRKFGKILRRMQDVDDNRSFKLYSHVDKRYHWDYTSVWLRNEKTYNPSKDGISSAYRDTELADMEFSSVAYNGILKKINKNLEEIYPEPEVTKADRQRSIDYINRFLV